MNCTKEVSKAQWRVLVICICIAITLSACTNATLPEETPDEPASNDESMAIIESSSEESSKNEGSSKNNDKAIYKISKEESYNSEGILTSITQYSFYIDEFEAAKCMSEMRLRIVEQEVYPVCNIIYKYDDNDVLQRKDTYYIKDDGSVSDSNYIEYLYDSKGRLKTSNEYIYSQGEGFDLFRTEAYEYDAAGNLTFEEHLVMPDSIEWTMRASYDKMGRILEEENINYGWSYNYRIWEYRADGTYLESVYEGLPSSIEDAALDRIYEYSANGRIQHLTYFDEGKNVTSRLDYYYNIDQQLQQIILVLSDNVSVLKHESIYDKNGCCIEERDYKDDGSLYNTKRYEYIQVTENLYATNNFMDMD